MDIEPGFVSTMVKSTVPLIPASDRCAAMVRSRLGNGGGTSSGGSGVDVGPGGKTKPDNPVIDTTATRIVSYICFCFILLTSMAYHDQVVELSSNDKADVS